MHEKRVSKHKTLVRLSGYIIAHKWMLLWALLLTFASNLLSLIGPALSGRAIDAIQPGVSKVIFPTVFYYCGLMLVFYIISSLLSYLLSTLMISFSQKVIYQMRKDVFDKLMVLPVNYFDGHQTGDIISRILYDIDTVNSSLSSDLVQICTSAITVIGSLVMMLMISPILTSVFAITVPLSILFSRYMSKKVRPLFRRRSAKLGELNGYVEEIISGHKTVKAYHQEQTMQERFDDKNKEAVDAYFDADYYGSMMGPSVNFINNLSLSLISVFGAILFLWGRLTLGNVSSFVLYSRKFSGPINEMANIYSELQSAITAAERVFRLIDEAPELEDAPNSRTLTNVRGKVDISNLSFGYSADKRVIHDLNLHVEPGKVVAIVGPTGAGKTTLVNLLMRFYDADCGTIKIDDLNILDINRASLRRAFAMVLQDTWLFHGTIYENIAYGKEDATMEAVIRVAKAAELHDHIMSLPDGYHTTLTEDGMNLSQGQKQLLTIARAMLLNAPMLILDEATSNVDTRTEQQIQTAMTQLMRDKTSFVIAHRLSTIQNADIILVVNNGNIIEQGTHGELLAKGGTYASLYLAQFN